MVIARPTLRAGSVCVQDTGFVTSRNLRPATDSATLPAMLDHVSLQVSDVDAAVRFYTSVFGPLGVTEVMRVNQQFGAVVALGGRDSRPLLWLGPTVEPAAAAREVHLGFSAASLAEIQAVHAAAVAFGTEVLHPPREWPGYHPGYYAVFLRDLDGNNVEAVWRRP